MVEPWQPRALINDTCVPEADLPLGVQAPGFELAVTAHVDRCFAQQLRGAAGGDFLAMLAWLIGSWAKNAAGGVTPCSTAQANFCSRVMQQHARQQCSASRQPQ
jgi:hypothetical protein